MYVELGRETIV